jgi:transcriptional regulator GlxA family with amidase domain
VRTRSHHVALLLFEEVELLDVAALAEVLTLAGRQWNWRPFRISTVAQRVGPVATRGQMRLEAEHDFTTCPYPELLIVPGGYGARRATAADDIVRWVRGAGQDASHLVAVGAGVGVLAAAGLLAGARVAIDASQLEWLGPIDPTMVAETEERLVTAGRVFTASRSGRALDLALCLVQSVLGDKQALAVADGLGHVWNDGVAKPERLRIDILE